LHPAHVRATSLLFILQLPPSSILFPYTTPFRSPSNPATPSNCASSTMKTETESITETDPEFETAVGYIRLSQDGKSLSRQRRDRSEEHTSELQSRFDRVCRLLLEKKKSQLSMNR